MVEDADADADDGGVRGVEGPGPFPSPPVCSGMGYVSAALFPIYIYRRYSFPSPACITVMHWIPKGQTC